MRGVEKNWFTYLTVNLTPLKTNMDQTVNTSYVDPLKIDDVETTKIRVREKLTDTQTWPTVYCKVRFNPKSKMQMQDERWRWL